MDSNSQRIKMFFFPFESGGGHLIPMIDIARLFASHGVAATIVVTPTTSLSFLNSIHRDQSSGNYIHLHTLQPPPTAAQPPPSNKPFKDTSTFQQPLQQLLLETPPDCLVFDVFHRWVAEFINDIEIPVIAFHGSGVFSRCCEESVSVYNPHMKVNSDHEPFELPGLPDRIVLTRSQLPEFIRSKNFDPGFLSGEKKSYGSVVNSFYDLEPDYVNYFRNVLGKKAWLVGPVSLCNRNVEDKIERGKPVEATVEAEKCLNWLDSKEPGSVLYASFGSVSKMGTKQLIEIAYGLEKSGYYYVWVVGEKIENGENWVPEGSEMGFVIKGWAPQLVILDHEAVGGFMSHCGWNSTLEGLSSGVAFVTWPLSAEQFYNEKLLSDVLGVGVRVGSEEWVSSRDERKVVLGREKVEAAVVAVMGEGGAEMRRKARELGAKARKAVEEGGSSYGDVVALIDEVRSRRKTSQG